MLLGGLLLTSYYNFLLFHGMAEMFSIAVGCGIFMFSWHSRRVIGNNYLVFVGIAYLFVAFFDMLHLLAYEGMGVFSSFGSDLATKFWVAARYTEAVSLLLAPLFLGRVLRAESALAAYGVWVFVVLSSIFLWDVFPTCYVDGVGLTPFKKTSEYIICAVLTVSMMLLLRLRELFQDTVLRLLAASIFVTVCSELVFASYVSVYGLANLTGHYFKIVSFFLIYKAVIQTGIERPYDLLFRNLKRSQKKLEEVNEGLELRVAERTRALEDAVSELSRTLEEQKQVEKDLVEAKRLYQAVVEDSRTGVLIEQEGRVRFANKKSARILGYCLEELTGTESIRLVHPDYRARVVEWERARLRGQDAPFEYESKGLRQDGSSFWVLMRNVVITFGGKPATLVNVIDFTKRKEFEEALRNSELELRALSSKLLSAEEMERKRIARELHDGIGQSLSAVKFSVENAVEGLRGVSDSQVVRSFEAVVPLIQSTIEEVRRIVMDLRPSMLDDLGIIATTSWFCREFKRIHPSVDVRKTFTLREDDVPDPLKTVVYRVLQEALNNVAKHSGADHVRVCMDKSDGSLALVVEDNGKGFDVDEVTLGGAHRKGFGLTSMRERAELTGGAFSMSSRLGEGTSLRVTWPLLPVPGEPPGGEDDSAGPGAMPRTVRRLPEYFNG